MAALVHIVAALGLFLAMVVQPAEQAPPQTPKVALESLAFLAGAWEGSMEGDPVEETWSRPRGDSIIGMFRWQHAGRTIMWELLTIKAEEAGPTLRLRHFNADVEPWPSEAEGVAAMKATTLEKDRVVFTNESDKGNLASCEYHCPTADRLVITVSFKPEAGRDALKFELRREK